MIQGEDVQLLSAGTKLDPYSQEQVESWDTPTEVTLRNVLCEPRPSGEPVQDARNAVTSGWTLYVQETPPAPITAANRVRVRGVAYLIIGEPAEWRMGARQAGIIVQTSRTAG